MSSETYFPIFLTGVRDGERIGSLPSKREQQNAGTILLVRGFFPPIKQKLRENQASIPGILNFLSNLPYFSGYTEEDILKNIESTSVEKEIYLNQLDNFMVKFIKIGGKGFTDHLSPEAIDILMRGNSEDAEGYWDIKVVYEMIVAGMKKKKSERTVKAGHGTLIFRPSIWMVLPENKIIKRYSGLWINTLTGDWGRSKIEGTIFVAEQPFSCGILIEKRKEPLTIENLNDIVISKLGAEMETLLDCEIFLSQMSPSMHKSLLQKIIRTRASSVSGFDGRLVLLSSLSLLMMSPGAFIPDLQKFSTGMESAIKRLAVSICEDSYISDHRGILSLVAAALIAQGDKNWKPTNDQISFWFDCALEALRETRYYVYSTKEKRNVGMDDSYSLATLLLEYIGGFESDINMFSTINGKFKEGKSESLEIPVYHLIDQHCITDIAYYINNPAPPKEIFEKIWRLSSGINPRKGMKFPADEPFFTDIRLAQNLIWEIKYNPDFRLLEAPREKRWNFIFEYNIHSSWLAAIIGVYEVRVGGKAILVTVRPDSIDRFIAVKKPSRDRKEIELSEEEKQRAIDMAISEYSRGLKKTIDTPAFPGIKSMNFIFEQETGTWFADGLPWEEKLATEYTLPIYEHSPEISLVSALFYKGEGALEGALEILENNLSSYPEAVLRRLIMHITGFKSKISMYPISKDGSGTELSVETEDIDVFKILLFLSYLFPAALVRNSLSSFKILHGPLFWWVRDQIVKYFKNSIPPRKNQWKPIRDKKERKLWEHQLDALKRLKERNISGGRGNIIWIPVGLGKTLIVFSYVMWLIEMGKLPPYIIYTLPPSAYESVLSEIQAFNIPTNLLIPTGKRGNRNLKPFTVNIIYHDSMRLMKEELVSLAPQSLFIIDEFHKALNPTKRTSIALELSKLSDDFIALSGTIVKDTNVDSLIQWLEGVCEFEVNKYNFYVGISAIISKRIETKVAVIRESIYVMLSSEEDKKYTFLMPPKLGGINKNPSHKDFSKAAEILYNACYKFMLKQALASLDEGVFVVMKDAKDAEWFKTELIKSGIQEKAIWIISSGKSIHLVSGTPTNIKCVITTPRDSEGYDITAMTMMLTSVYPMNDATREQLEGRINRISQKSPYVKVMTFHTGFLTNIFENHEEARHFSSALKGYSDLVKIYKE